VTPNKIKWAINSFDSYKSPDLDGIQPVHLQKVNWLLLPLLTKIFRASLAISFIPNIWRMTRVIFIPKPGRDSYDQAKAFQPVCLSSFLLKILEKIMDRHIKDMLESNAPLHRNQFAYQSGKSTQDSLASIGNKE
jgi:hypothetical protein